MGAGRPKDWETRIGILRRMGWGSEHPTEWPEFLVSLNLECSVTQMARALGFVRRVLTEEMRAAGYEPIKNHRARRRSYNGETVQDIARRLGISYHTAYTRLRAGNDPTVPATGSSLERYKGKTRKEWAEEWGLSYARTCAIIRLKIRKGK